MMRRSPPGKAPAGGKLFGSPTGDLWVLNNGALTRIAEVSPGGMDQDQWKQTVLPLFTRLCSLCHLPGGSSGIDLSTYSAWTARRALVGQRVLVGKPTPMPPAGAGTLTSDDRAALQAWVNNMP